MWWLNGQTVKDGEITLCVEAIGESIRDARRESIRIGQRSAARALQPARADEIEIVYERIWIWPTRSTGRTETTYAAFVMLHASVPSAE